MKTIYYYQTFVGLDKALTHIEDVDVFIVSSISYLFQLKTVKPITNLNSKYQDLLNEITNKDYE